VPIAFQLLDCPMLDDRQTTPSIRADGLYVWKAESNEFAWRAYLGTLYGSDDVPAYAAPARATDLTGLPPTCVVVGSIDGFRDEDIDYAQRLNQSGVSCELHVIAGLPHAYLLVPEAAAVQHAMHSMEDWLTRQLTASAAD
jgi:acetyl esterase/lipase